MNNSKIVLSSDKLSVKGGDIKKKDKEQITVFDIPLILFEEISQAFGIEEEVLKTEAGGFYKFRKLNPQNKTVGYNAAIVYHKNDDFIKLILWLSNVSSFPLEDKFSLSQRKLEICASFQDTGLWIYGQGNEKKESLDASFLGLYYGNLNLDCPAINLISMILWRAHQLVFNPDCIRHEFWEKDCFPEGNYTDPD